MTTEPLKPRVCRECGKGKGTVAFRWKFRTNTFRDYFHPQCFIAFKLKLED